MNLLLYFLVVTVIGANLLWESKNIFNGGMYVLGAIVSLCNIVVFLMYSCVMGYSYSVPVLMLALGLLIEYCRRINREIEAVRQMRERMHG